MDRPRTLESVSVGYGRAYSGNVYLYDGGLVRYPVYLQRASRL